MCIVTFSWDEPDSLVKIKEYKKSRSPTWCLLEITEFCNFKCKWCYANSPQKSKNHMPKEKALQAIDILKNSGISQITFTGGEPTLHPDLIELIGYASSQGIIPHLNTNSYLLDEDFVKKLAKAGLTQVQVNLSTLSKELHDGIHGMPGSFEQNLKSIKYCIENGIEVAVQTVMTSANESEILDIMEFARDAGAQRYRVWDMTPSGTALENKELLPGLYSKKLKEIMEKAESFGVKNVISYEPTVWLQSNSIAVENIPCPQKLGMVVNCLVNGEVCYCCTVRDRILYNLFEHSSISEIHKKKIAEETAKIGKSKLCNGCKMEPTCSGGCAARMDSNNFDVQCPKLRKTPV